MPPLWLMLNDIGNPKPRELARVFGVSERTVRAWLKADTAPLPVMWSIFWLTRWGASSVNADAVNDARQQAGLANALRTELDAALLRLERLGRIADFGAANDPAPGVPRLPLVSPPGEAARRRREGDVGPQSTQPPGTPQTPSRPSTPKRLCARVTAAAPESKP
jgi:hypothetical protein